MQERILSGALPPGTTIVPAEAWAHFNVRLAPTQDFNEMKATVERLIRDAVPEGAEVEFKAHGEEGAVFDPSHPAVKLATEGIAEACGKEAALIRSGGSIAALAGFAVGDGR